MDAMKFNVAKRIVNSFDSVAMFDKEGRYVYVNDNWLNNRGETVENVIGRYVQEIVKDSKVPIILKTHKPIAGEIIETKDGTYGALTFYWPIIEKEEFMGVLICSTTRGLDNLYNMNRKLQSISTELDEYKKLASNTKYNIDDIVGESEAIKSMKEQIALASRFNSTVLIEGETGTGKELVAHSIHNISERKFGRFIRVNCSAIPQELMESEFFGYEEGAFTGAKKGGKKGKFELANNGSIFFDEVNQLPLVMQPKFLRVLQEGEIDPVGGKYSLPIDVRVIAATNTSLEKMVENNEFRSDLYFRLNVIKIKIPPLRERKEDIPIISKSIVDRLNIKMGTTINHIDQNVLKLFSEYEWPGNIRELQNVIESAMTLTWGDNLELKHFNSFSERTNKQNIDSINVKESNSTLKNIGSEVEMQVIIRALKKCDGNKTETAKHLGISRNALYKKIKKYNL